MEENKEEAKSEKKDKNSKNAFVEKLRKNPWIVSTSVLVIVLAAMLLFKGGGVSCNAVSSDIAAQNLISFIEAQGQSADIVSSSQDGGLYEVVIKYNGQDMPVYMTLDGKNIIPSKIPVTAQAVSDDSSDSQNSPPKEIPKSDKPVAELFVMTHCPYGTQSEKGIIPALKTLGNTADVKIRFVHYFMHGDKEEQETYTQVCIREEQSSKFIPYLECFLKAGESNDCITGTQIDKKKLEECVAGKAKEYYAADSALSNKYGVQGSPTLVINGVQSEAGRSPASYLAGICAAFNEAPAQCKIQISSANPSPGFGTASSDSGAGSGAGCASA